MADNGNGNRFGNWQAKSAAKSAQLLVADMVGNVAELAFLRYQGVMNNAFPWVKTTFKAIIREPVKLVQKPVEDMLEHASNFEDKSHHDQRINQTKEQRLDGLLDAAYDYTTALGVGGAALVLTERAMSKMMKTEHMPWWSWMVDGVAHTGIIAYMGSDRMRPTTEKIRKTIENGMVSAGWNEDSAKRDAGFATVYIIPNYMNWLSNSALAAGMYYGESKGAWKPTEGMFKNLHELGKQLGIFSGQKSISH